MAESPITKSKHHNRKLGVSNYFCNDLQYTMYETYRSKRAWTRDIMTEVSKYLSQWIILCNKTHLLISSNSFQCRRWLLFVCYRGLVFGGAMLVGSKTVEGEWASIVMERKQFSNNTLLTFFLCWSFNNWELKIDCCVGFGCCVFYIVSSQMAGES
jgi:hypothetical protein